MNKEKVKGELQIFRADISKEKVKIGGANKAYCEKELIRLNE